MNLKKKSNNKVIDYKPNHKFESFMKKEKEKLVQEALKKANFNKDQLLVEQLGDKFKELKINDHRMRTVLANQALYNLGAKDVNPDLYELSVGHDILNGIEYIRVKSDGQVKEREESYYSGEADEPDEHFKWISTLKEKHPELLEN